MKKICIEFTPALNIDFFNLIAVNKKSIKLISIHFFSSELSMCEVDFRIDCPCEVS